MLIFGATSGSDKFNLDRIYAMFSKDFQKIIIIIIIINITGNS
jgi:hypothetical protein